MLLEKIGIYLTGARKRGKTAEVEEYEAKRARWSEELRSWQGGTA
jgi:hypothetical protein